MPYSFSSISGVFLLQAMMPELHYEDPALLR